MGEATGVALAADHFERPAARVKPAVAQSQRWREVMIERMSARLRLERQRKGRIRIDVDRVDRIHLDRDGETHLSSSIRRAGEPLSGPDRDRAAWPEQAQQSRQRLARDRDAAGSRRKILPRDMQKDRAAAARHDWNGVVADHDDEAIE